MRITPGSISKKKKKKVTPGREGGVRGVHAENHTCVRKQGDPIVRAAHSRKPLLTFDKLCKHTAF